jgi:hypothetical protein
MHASFRYFGVCYRIFTTKIILVNFQVQESRTKMEGLNATAKRQFQLYRLIFYLDKKDGIYHYSSKEHPKISN